MKPGYGTIDNPLSLADATANPRILAGHVVYLRAGTYRADVICKLQGTAEQPITVRPYPGERAILCGGFSDSAARYVNYIDMEFTADFPRIWSSPTSAYDPGVDFANTGGKVINCTIHDASNMGAWDKFDLVYGCITYNQGEVVTGASRGYGHSLYHQNSSDPAHKKTIKHNVIGRSAGYGLHGYGQTNPLRNMDIVENVLLPGSIHLIGSMLADDGITMTGNHAFGSLQIGYGNKDKAHLTLTGNILGNLSGLPLAVDKYTSGSIADNVFVVGEVGGSSDIFRIQLPAGSSALTIDNNVYHNRTGKARCFATNGVPPYWLDLATWQSMYGWDINSTITLDGSAPADSVHVYPNDYAAVSKRKALVVIWNWSQAACVSVDLSALGLAEGTACKLLQAQDPLGDQRAFTMPANKTISVTMSGTVAGVTGWTDPASTFPTFGAFMVEV